MNDWQVVVPHIGPKWNLRQCLASMGKITVPLLIVDNSPDSHTKTMGLPDGAQVEYYPQNLGVAASWNRGLKQGARWTMICSASMRFGEGGLGRVIDLASAAADERGLLLYNNYSDGPRTLGWHIIVIGHATVTAVGYFDENFYPAYWEDNDYGYRMHLAGMAFPGVIPLPSITVPDLAPVGHYVALSSGAVKGLNMSDNEAYYEKKWGGPSAQEKWVHPFNDPTKGIDWWPKK